MSPISIATDAALNRLAGIVTMQIATLTAWIGKLVQAWLGRKQPYRPERHYMRGPGPKAQARGSGAASVAQPNDTHVKA
jgi:hypothetical protein